MTEYCSAGFPHSDISGSMRMCRSPKLFAACHVLLRLLMPRHSPCALFRLTSRRESFRIRVSGSQNYAGSFSRVSRNCFYPNFLKFHNLTKKLSFCCLACLPLFSFQCADFRSVGNGPRRSVLRTLGSVSGFPARFPWWAEVDSNHRPHDYQSCALTS